MVKKYIALLALITVTNAQAHAFYPDSYTVTDVEGSSSMILTHLVTKEDAAFEFSFYTEGDESFPERAIKIPGKQVILSGESVDLPVKIPKRLVNGHRYVTICSTQLNKKVTMQKEVCLRVDIV